MAAVGGGGGEPEHMEYLIMSCLLDGRSLIMVSGILLIIDLIVMDLNQFLLSLSLLSSVLEC